MHNLHFNKALSWFIFSHLHVLIKNLTNILWTFFFLLFHILLILLLFNVICTLRLIWLVYIGHTKLQRNSLVIHLILKSLTVSHSEWLNLIFFFFFFCSIKKDNYFISINKKEVRRIKSFCYVHNLTKKKKTFQEKTKTICRCERDC